MCLFVCMYVCICTQSTQVFTQVNMAEQNMCFTTNILARITWEIYERISTGAARLPAFQVHEMEIPRKSSGKTSNPREIFEKINCD